MLEGTGHWKGSFSTCFCTVCLWLFHFYAGECSRAVWVNGASTRCNSRGVRQRPTNSCVTVVWIDVFLHSCLHILDAYCWRASYAPHSNRIRLLWTKCGIILQHVRIKLWCETTAWDVGTQQRRRYRLTERSLGTICWLFSVCIFYFTCFLRTTLTFFFWQTVRTVSASTNVHRRSDINKYTSSGWL